MNERASISVPNQLLASLPAADLDRVLQASDDVPIALGDILCEFGEPAEHVYFPQQGFISLITRIDGHPGLEVGMVGNEGMLGAQWALGVGSSPWQGLVQGGGAVRRIRAQAFRRELRASATLQRQMHRYVYVLLTQQSLAAACIHNHEIGPRLARWLLMSHDRAQVDQFHVTHEFLASMLGVRRVGVTMAAGELQRRGLVSYHRGELSVLNRAGLEATACGCYARQHAVYAEVMAPDAG